MSDSTSGGCPPGEQSFEACLSELQDLVRLLEGGSLGLAESIAGFERGISLLRHCYQTLEQAEQKIELLSGFDRSGNPIMMPFDAASTLETSQAAADRREKARAEPAPKGVAEPKKSQQSERAPEPEPGAEVSLPGEGELF